MSIDAMKQALEYTRPGAIVPVTPETVKILVDALRLAIEQAERQEPVAWMWKDGTLTIDPDRADGTWTPLYTAPPQQEKQEPVGFMNAGHIYELQQGRLPYGYVYPESGTGADVAVYTAPPQRHPLTDGEMELLWGKTNRREHFFGQHLDFARAIERAHGIGGGE